MNSIPKALAISLAVFQFTNVALAAEPAPPPVSDRTGRQYIFFAGGDFRPDSIARLPNETSSYGFAMGFGSRYSRHAAWEIEFAVQSQEVDSPPNVPPTLFSGTRSDIETVGLAGNLRFIYPLGNFEPYVGGGIGLYRAKLEVNGSFLASPAVTESDIGFGLQLLAGMEYYFGLGRHSVGLQYRKLIFNADFGPVAGGKVNVGGDSLFLTFRRSF